MAINPNIFYRAGAIKGQLAQQANQNRQQQINTLASKVGNYVSAKKDQYDKNMSDFNGEIPRDDVPESAMMDLTRHIAREKSVYTKNAKIIRSSLSRKKKREAMEENEKIKSGLAAVYSDFKKAKAMGQSAEKLIPFLAKGADLEKKDNALDFANNTWYERGVKFTRDGMTINGVREEQVIGEDGQPLPQSKLVNYDQRLSDISFPEPVKGTGGKAFSQTAQLFQDRGKNEGRLLTEESLEVKKAEYVQGLKNMPVEEQRHLYFNGVGGFPGSSQAETDAAKAIGLDAKGFEKMNEPIDENDPKDVAEKTRLREQFQNQLNALTTKKEFLTPELIDNQWSTILQAYDSGVKEYERKDTERKNYQASRNQKRDDLGRYLTDGTYANDTRVKEMIDNIKNNEKVVYGKDEDGNIQVYTPERGGYKAPDGKIISKKDLSLIINLPVKGVSGEIDDATRMNKLNLNVSDFEGTEINAGTYTVVGGKAYTKDEFMKATQDGTLNEEQVNEGGANQVKIQNLRGSS